MMSTAATAGSVRVLLFARYAELLGTEQIEFPAAEARTVSELIERVRRLPNGERLPEHVLTAVNLVQVQGDQSLAPGDEVALLPPLAGG